MGGGGGVTWHMKINLSFEHFISKVLGKKREFANNK